MQNSQILKITIRKGQSNLRFVFIFVSCKEKCYYRTCHFGRKAQFLSAACTAGDAAVCKTCHGSLHLCPTSSNHSLLYNDCQPV